MTGAVFCSHREAMMTDSYILKQKKLLTFQQILTLDALSRMDTDMQNTDKAQQTCLHETSILSPTSSSYMHC